MIISRKKFERLVEKRLREERGQVLEFGNCVDYDPKAAGELEEAKRELIKQLCSGLDKYGAVKWDTLNGTILRCSIRVVIPETEEMDGDGNA